MSEQIIADLKKAGSDDMGSLVDMLNSYKEKEAVSQEAIDQLKELQVHKDDEIMGLEVEVQSLRDFMGGVRATQEAKIVMYRSEIEQNAKLIRRQDKLIVDLQQKNEVSQNAVVVTQEEAMKKNKQKDNLQMKMKELSDQRDFFCESISGLEGRIGTVRSFIQSQNLAKQPVAAQEADTSKNAGKKKAKKRLDEKSDATSIASSPMRGIVKK